MRLPLLILAACLLLCAQTASPPPSPQGESATVTVRATPTPVVTAGPHVRVCSIPLLEAKKGDTHDRIGVPVPPGHAVDAIKAKVPAPPCDAKSK
jgi:hypothetical protein